MSNISDIIQHPLPIGALVADSGYSIEQGDFGLRLVLHGEWRDEFLNYMLLYGIKELNVNYARGFSGTSLDFLRHLPFLEGLLLLVYHIPDISAVHGLHELRSFVNGCRDKTPLDFEQFPKLERCGINWRKGSEALFQCSKLTWLNISNFSKPTEDFERLTHLNRLEITYGSKIQNLAGLGSLKSLRILGLYWLRHLTTLADISDLTDLEVLDIQTCTKLKDIEDVKTLIGLKHLNVVNCGEIPSLKPIVFLPILQRIGFYGTNILDGDLSVLANLPSIENYYFNYKRHYSHRRLELLQMREARLS